MDGVRRWWDGVGGDAIPIEHMPGKKGGRQSQATSKAKTNYREK